ncbi:MAG: SUMF1/EgtB/PvdO family nonheme iron enzyme [Victivallaceae bacterium]|nr:SUMF1/EgtB/PvdO family nonheme iron enzyme [Victivallaceae bacterium]
MLKRIFVTMLFLFLNLLCCPLSFTADKTVRYFDFGSGNSIVWPGFTLVTETTRYTPSAGFGWEDSGKLRSVLHPNNVLTAALDDLAIDFVGIKTDYGKPCQSSMTFKVNVPPGRYRIWMLFSYYIYPRDRGMEISVSNGERKNFDLSRQEFYKNYFQDRYQDYGSSYTAENIWEKFVDSGMFEVVLTGSPQNGSLYIKCTPEAHSYYGAFFKARNNAVPLAAMIIYPEDRKKEMDERIVSLRKERKKQWETVKRRRQIPIEEWERPELVNKYRKQGYILFTRNYMKAIFPGSSPRPEEVLTERNAISVVAARNEYEPATLCVKAITDLDDIRINISPFSAKETKNVLSPSIVKIRVERQLPNLVASNENALYNIGPGHITEWNAHNLKIPKGIAKRFWLTVHIPKDTIPGNYYGKLSFKAKGHPVSTIPFKLRVLPFVLEKFSDEIRVVDYVNPDYCLTDPVELKRRVEADFQDIKEHGYDSVGLYFADWGYIQTLKDVNVLPDGQIKVDLDTTVFDIYAKAFKKVKLDGYIFFMAYPFTYPLKRTTSINGWKIGTDEYYRALFAFYEEVERIRKKQNWPPLIYEVGGETGYNDIEVDMLKRLTKRFPSLKFSSRCSNEKQIERTARFLPFIVTESGLDPLNLKKAMDLSRTHRWLLYGGTVWWGRFGVGFYLARAGGSGCYAEWYRYTCGNPYNNLLEHNGFFSYTKASPSGEPYPQYYWEIWREGADDYRYWRTLEEMLKKENTEIKDAAYHAAFNKARKVLDKLRAEIHVDYSKNNGTDWILGHFKGGVNCYDNWRLSLINSIISLINVSSGTSYSGLSISDNKPEKPLNTTLDKKPEPHKGMVRIPSGNFFLGTSDKERDLWDHIFGSSGKEFKNEVPKTVHLPEFWIDIFEVTNQDYAEFVKATGHLHPDRWGGKVPPRGTERCPVVGVTLKDAELYAAWKGKRLPTSEEWEKASRGLDGRTWPWSKRELPFGMDSGGVFDFLASQKSQINLSSKGVLPVGTCPKDRSPYGVYDMGGNVSEWTSSQSIVKGGSWRDGAIEARCAFVRRLPSEEAYDFVGFRCASETSP